MSMPHIFKKGAVVPPMMNTVNNTITTVVLSIMYRSDVGIPTTNPTAIAP